MARDKFHNIVRVALEKDGWQITDDPLSLKSGEVEFEIDLAAEQLIAATRNNQKIAVEIKSFISSSPTSDFHTALGQFINYRDALEILEPDRTLYLAVRTAVYKSFFQRPFIINSVRRYKLRLLIYDVKQEVISEWL